MYGISLTVWLCCIIPPVNLVSVFRHLHYFDDLDLQVPVNGVCRPPRTSECDVGFSYNRNICRGPTTWSTISTCFRSCNNGLVQSPIDIVSKQTKFVPNLPKLLLRPEFLNLKVLAGNNHNHAPNFVADSPVGPDLVMRHPFLTSGIYRFHELHVHIGQKPDRGSEHSVNGVHTPMEAHMVFFNTLKGGTFEEASKQNGGLLVIGVFLEVLKNHRLDKKYFGLPPSRRACRAILKGIYARRNPKTKILHKRKIKRPKAIVRPKSRIMTPWQQTSKIILAKRRYKRSSVVRKEILHKKQRGKCQRRKAKRLSLTLECAYRSREVRQFAEPQTPPSLEVLFSPSEALPVSRDYYAYKGSLTTPPCTQNVQWIVMRCSLIVSKRVLLALQRVQGYRDGRTLQYYGIRRPTQTNRNGVFRNFNSNSL